MELDDFLKLPMGEVSRLVRSAGPLVCCFPINGTRRWFLLENPPGTWEGRDFLNAYHEKSVSRQLEIYSLFFNHGIHTLMMPLFGPDLMERGSSYQQVMMDALVEMASSPRFLEYYRENGVRVRFYGDYRRYLCGTPYAGVCDVFDRLADLTATHARCRLLYGVFAHDASETVAALSVRFYQEHGVIPTRDQLVKMYYGEAVGPVNLFIGFDRFSAFDMPLVSTGNEDLYFTASPSFYISQDMLRRILHDHLYLRRVEDQDYSALSQPALERMRHFYLQNRDAVFGVGVVRDGLWYPLPGLSTEGSFNVMLED